MTATRQYVACKFRVSDTRTFTYHWDGEPFEEGATVRVPDPRSGDGWKKVYVVDPNAAKPTEFDTKAIIGRHVEEKPTPLEAAVEAAPGREFKHVNSFGLPSLD